MKLLPLCSLSIPMRQYGLSYEEALAWEKNQAILPVMLLQSGKTALPKELWEKIASEVIAPENLEEPVLTGPQMRRVATAVKEAFDSAMPALLDQWFKDQETTLRTRLFGTKKANQLSRAVSVTERTEALAQHRFQRRTKPSFLPKSLQQTMTRYPEYANSTALRHWLENCATYLEQRFSRRFKAQGQALRALLVTSNFPSEATTEPSVLANILLKKHEDGKSLKDVLAPLPHWTDLLTRFPVLAKELEKEEVPRNKLI